MIVRLITSPRARQDIDTYADFISSDNPRAGVRFYDRVRDTIASLREQPRRGRLRGFRSGSLAGLRSWPVTGFANHLVFYLVNEDRLLVMRVPHGSRNLKRALKEESFRRAGE